MLHVTVVVVQPQTHIAPLALAEHECSPITNVNVISADMSAISLSLTANIRPTILPYIAQ
jgi:hypothetical protein